MNTKQNNKLVMILAVITVCNRYSALWENVPGFRKNLENLLNRSEKIRKLGQRQIENSTGKTRDKQAVRELLVDAALQVAGAVRAWAADADNHEMLSAVKFSRSQLLHRRDVNLGQECQNILTTATEHSDALAEYGISPEKLQDLEAKIGAYNGALTKPRDNRVEVTAATEQLAKEVDAADFILAEKLDGLMEQFKASEPNFFAEYNASRNIIDRPGGHAATPPPPPAPAQ